ncbi:expressed conserved protein [Echinococcus multilocularis]|uniref:Expressed conserved protein n=1 Tax=Echinococcus multilocularis TaxID=6211 RepID=A0A068YEC1_ECHMU|nr:expressed conserved protein [Echinococcus multilocularis]
MGCCFSKPSEADRHQPSVEERRRLQAEAAERRREEAAIRGIVNPASVRRHQKLTTAENMRLSDDVQHDAGLRWTVSV